MSRSIGLALVASAAMVVGVGCGSNPMGPDEIPRPNPTPAPVALTGVTVDGAATAAEGESLQLKAVATFSDGSTQDVSTRASWLSSRPSIARVSGTGLVTAVTAGTADVSASFEAFTGRHTLTVGAAEWEIEIDLSSFTARDACDDVTQGLTTMEVAYQVAVELANGQQAVLADTGYPGNPSGSRLNGVVQLREGQVVPLSGSRRYRLPGRAGEFARVEFRATEWDEQIVVFPPSVRWVRDDSMDNRSGARTHGYSGGAWSSLGNNSITLGSSGCQVRLDYSVTATRR